MLVPVEWYQDSAIILDEVLPGHQENMQTSLIPYSHKWADIVHERFRGVLGTSIDFSTRQINGSVEEYQRIWLEKGMARKDGIELFPVTVVTKGELGMAPFLIDWFLDNGFSYVTFEKYVEYGHMLFSDMTKNSEYSGFLIQAFDDTFKRMKAGKKVLYINPILSSLRGILSGEPGHKWGFLVWKTRFRFFRTEDFIPVRQEAHRNPMEISPKDMAPFWNPQSGLPIYGITI
uniref:Uncharacterized protein n=1 Tax=Leptospirillum ferriphilum TaxID=178606 RepID=A0A2I2MFG6_9BACT